MNEPKHTPGTWEVSDSSIVAGDICICTIEDDGGYEAPIEQRQGNARLIAAAPELLSAATKMLAFYEDLSKSNPGFIGKLTLQDYAQWNEALIELPRAIAKATEATRES